MLVDTHCHVNFSAFKDDADDVIRRALDNDIWVINVGSQYSTSRRAVKMAEKYDQGVYAVVGLHPIHLQEVEVDEDEHDIHFRSRAEEFDYDRYRTLAQHPKVVGIGEMGIDYFHMPEGCDLEKVKAMQRETFERGIALAQELDKPVVIHIRPSPGTFDAYDDAIEIVSRFTSRKFGFKGVVHCFGGTSEQAEKFLEMGLLLSFTGIVTFKNAQEMQAMVKALPLEKIMVETDAPYLAPEPYRGKRNEPSFVKYVARTIAELKKVSFQEMAEVTTASARTFFGI